MTTVQPTNREVITRKDTKKAVDEYHSVPRYVRAGLFYSEQNGHETESRAPRDAQHVL